MVEAFDSVPYNKRQSGHPLAWNMINRNFVLVFRKMEKAVE